MIQSFFKDSLLYGLSALLTKGVGLFLLPFYARMFSPADYGAIDYLAIWGSFLGIIITLEISQGLARSISEHAMDSKLKILYSSTSLWFTIIVYSILCVVTIVFAPQLAQVLLGSETFDNILIIASFGYFMSSLVYLIQNQLRWELRSRDSSLVSVAFAIATLFFALCFVVFLDMGINGALLATMAAASVSGIFGFYLCRSSYDFVFDYKKLWEMLSYSSPLVLSSVAVVGAMYIDRIFIKEMMGLEDLGYYGVGNRIALIVSLAIVGFQGAITPLVYHHHKNDQTKSDIERIFRYFTAISSLIFSVITIFAPYIVLVVAGERYMPSAGVIPFLSLSILFASMYVFAPGLGINKKTVVMALINIAAVIVGIVLNILLIPMWGIMGAALSTLICAIFAFVGTIVLSQRLYYVDHKWNSILLCWGIIVSLSGITMVFPFGTIFDFLLRSMITIMLPAILLFSGIVKKGEFLFIFHRLNDIKNNWIKS